MLHHHYFDRERNEWNCAECANAVDYCLSESVTVDSVTGANMSAKLEGENNV